MVYESFCPKDTYDIARQMGEKAQRGQIYCLNGDLGVGKTLFSQGFAKGLGVDEYVNSPTFTILQEYPDGRLPLYHFDVYRIEDPEEMEEIGFFEFAYGDGVCLIEWADRIADILPERVIRVALEKDLEKGLDYRRLIIEDMDYGENERQGEADEDISR